MPSRKVDKEHSGYDTIRKVCLCAGMTFEPKTDNLVRS